MNRRLLLLAPFGVVAAGGAAFWTMLDRMRAGSFDPRGVPSMLIDKPAPAFALPGLTLAELRAVGTPVLINFFASWCVPCIQEAPVLMDLKRSGVTLWGIAYKDRPADTDAFLARHGNPFARMAHDAGTVAIDFGVYGVPESYLIDAGGIVRWRWTGALTAEAVGEQLRPLLVQLA